jgi:Asp-tRNA(Asn)/Glu-tRNA(Gln) amidotransferase C subunit
VAIPDDIARMAHLAGLSVSPGDLERLAPALQAMFADLDRLMALPIADLEPAFTPRLGGGAPDDELAAR